MNQIKCLFLTLFCLLAGSALHSQTEDIYAPYQFQHLSEDDGLINNKVHCGLLDSRGFMWFGTHTGLARWDGLEFKNFLPDEQDSTSISGALITNLLEDKEGYIWSVSHHGDLCRFDPIEEVFKKYAYPILENNSLIRAPMKIYQDTEGLFWIGAFDEGFLKFDPIKETFKRYQLKPGLISIDTKFSQNSVLDIIEDNKDQHILWIAANDGLYRFDKNTEELQHFPSTHPYSQGTSIQSILQEGTDNLWLGTYGAGLVKFAIPTKTWTYFTPNKAAWEAWIYSNNIITDIAYKSEEEIWVSSKDQGVGIFNSRTEKFSFFKHLPEEQNSIISNVGHKIYKDSKNRVWFFMDEKGISYLDADFQNFLFHPMENISLQGETPFKVQDFLYQEDDKKLYVVGKGIEGLYEVDLMGKIQKTFPLKGYEGKAQIYNDILQTSNQQIFIASGRPRGGVHNNLTLRPSLLHLNATTNQLAPYTSSEIEAYQLQKKNINALIETEPNNIWGITGGGELFHLRLLDGAVRLFKYQDTLAVQRGFQCIAHLAGTNQIYIGTNKGLIQFDYQKEQFEIIEHTTDLNITCLQERKGKLWLGGYDLKCLNLATKRIDPINEFSNKPNVPIDKLFVDTQKRLWCTTQSGLYYLDTELKNFVHFGVNNGLFKEFFYFNGVHQLPNGRVLLGKEDGFFSFSPEKILSSIQSNQLTITTIKINDKLYKLRNDKLDLSHDENSINISFSPLIFSNQEKVQMTYQLEGMDDDWIIPTRNRNFAVYNKLPPDDYVFKLKNLSQDSAEAFRLPICISPPFYKTSWAYIGYFLISFSFLYWLNQNLIQKRVVEHEAKRLKELDEFKTKLYANITHEFRTPLTVISGMAEQIESGDAKHLIKKNTKSLLELVNQMLDLSKLEAGQLKPNYVQGDIILYLKYLVASFDSFAVTQQKTVSFSSAINTLQMDYEPDFLKRIVSNLVANALKFTHKGGAVKVIVSTTDDLANKQLLLEFQDNGIGITADQLPKIFDRFYKVNAIGKVQREGTGIGLTLVKELIDLLKGDISVNSVVDQGSSFQIHLPITQTAQSKVPFTETSDLTATTLLEEVAISLPVATKGKNKDERPLLLIIEDNDDVVHYLQTILSKTYQLEIARNGKIGIEKAQASIPDIIISDVMMPQMDGYQVCEFLKKEERTSHIPIILLTAKATQADKIQGLQYGADAYLTKPFDQKELLIRLKHIVEQRQHIQAYFEQYRTVPKSIPVEHQFIQKVKQIIEANYQKDSFALPQLCEALHLSRTQVFRKVKALTNQSPSDMILHFRLQAGKSLLQNEDLTITEVAFQVGFKNQTHFSNAYKKHFGVTPSGTRTR